MKGQSCFACIATVAVLLACSCNSEPGSTPVKSLPANEITTAQPDCNAIFNANCASCHNPLVDANGPALKGALARWDNDTARIKSFIRNSGKMIAEGDPRATELYRKWQAPMTAFPDLTNEEMNCLLEMMK